MKKKTSILTFILLLVFISQGCLGQEKYVTDTYDVENFHSIKSESIANIVIRQTPTTSVKIHGPENLLNAIDVYVSDGKLVIKSENKMFKKWKNRNRNKVIINIMTPVLCKIESEGVGNIIMEGEIKTAELKIETEGVGNVKANNIIAEQIEIDSEGVGNIIIGGTADYASIKSEGVGNINAQQLKAKRLKVISEGVGNVICFASDNLDATSGGIGNITYYGNPKTKNINKNGIGKIRSGK